MKYQNILDNLLPILDGYYSVYRQSIQPVRQRMLDLPETKEGFADCRIRENLMEHVGILPVVATYLHPYMDLQVDLGKVLQILAVHDIGEVYTGDEIAFKKDRSNQEEYEAAVKLVHPSQVTLLDEFEKSETYEAKYAHAIDKITPDIQWLLVGVEFDCKRLATQVGWTQDEVIDKVEKYKQQYILWSEFFVEFHAVVMNRLRQERYSLQKDQ
jgi:5'-deoxynucleotidase YfbR-like HD superfamily hydrolase